MSDFRKLREGYPKDPDYPDRTHQILAYRRVLEGTLYDELKHPFGEEKGKSGEYVPLAQRRPSARTRICRTVVNDSVSLLFSEGHWPAIECVDEKVRETLGEIVEETTLNAIMIDAATRGSVGSICVHMRVLKARVFFGVMTTEFLTPKWKDDAPDTLESVTERYKLTGQQLKDFGYAIDDDDLKAEFWFQRVWDAAAETWFVPLKKADAKDGATPRVDTGRTVQHGLGFVPMVWIRNLPGGDETDGSPTFPSEAIDTQIEADYLLSQGGRGLKYQSDPTLLIKEPAFASDGGARIVKGAANALVVSAENGDAKLLEISGDAATAVMEWVKGLRDIALEGMGGNRSNPDKLSAAQSGRAMELMNQALIWLADKLRISYGQGALLALLTMVVAASNKYPLKDKRGKDIGRISDAEKITLRWPQWYAPTYADKQVQASTLGELRTDGLLSRETAIKALAPAYDIHDVEEEIAQIEADPPATPDEGKPKSASLKDADD